MSSGDSEPTDRAHPSGPAEQAAQGTGAPREPWYVGGMPLVSLVVPVLDDVDVVLACLEAIVEAVDDVRHDYEVVLTAAQATSKEAEALFATLQGDIRVVRAGEAIPLAEALNAGARAGTGDVVVFLEPGTYPMSGWLDALIAALSATSSPLGVGADLAGSVLQSPDGRVLRGAYGFREGIGDLHGYPIYAGVDAVDGLVAREFPCQTCAGGSLALRRDAFEALDGFDAGLSGKYLWLDLGLRAAEAGMRVVTAGLAGMRSGGTHELSPMGEFIYRERFNERWNGKVRADLFDQYAADGFRVAGVRMPSAGPSGDARPAQSGSGRPTQGGSGGPSRIVLRNHDTGAVVEAAGLEGPWPAAVLERRDDRFVIQAVDGGVPWGVPEGAIDRSRDQASHYEVTAAEKVEGAHRLLLELTGEGKRVLELGCASGYFTRHLLERGCTVVGVEIDAAAAEQARKVTQRVLIGDLETMDLGAELGPATFDAIVAGDVLEHLRDPGAVLERLRPLLAPGGAIVASVPNVTHATVRLALLMGQWRYRSLGLLDRTHLRFFTRWSVLEMLRRSGFRLEQMLATRGGLEGLDVYTPPEVLPAGIAETAMQLPDADVYQFVFRAVPRVPRIPTG